MIKKINYNYIDNKTTTFVLLHGWGMDKTSFDELVHFFCKKYSVLTLDFFGFGESDRGEDYYDTYEYAYQVYLLLNELNIKDVILVGHSFGGRVAIILSAIFGIKIKGMVLTSSAGLVRFDLLKFIKITTYKIMKKLKIINANNNGFGSGDYRKLDSVMKGIFVRVVNDDLTYLLKKITCKTILNWDKKDKETPYWICKKLHKKIRYSKVIIFNNGGHFAYLFNKNKFFKICVCVLENGTNI